MKNSRLSYHLIYLCLFSFLFSLLPSTPAFAQRNIEVVAKDPADVERRIALVIGNSDYENSPLANPVNDAADMAAALGRLGFRVTLGRDMTRKQMRSAIRQFGKDLKQGGVGLFYYAGHGMQVQGKNFLIPIETDIRAEFEVEEEAVDAGSVLRHMENADNAMNMVFLDACRNNPFARSFRSANQGLAQMDAPSGSLIVYATAPGSVAADGVGERNGIFTKHLLAHLQTPSLTITQMLMKVRVDVQKETNRQQVPWESSSLVGDFYFVPGTQVAGVPPPVTPPPLKQITPPVFQIPGESELDRKIREATEKQKRIDGQFAKLEQMDALGDTIISAEEKKKTWREFIEQHPGMKPRLEAHKVKLARLQLERGIDQDYAQVANDFARFEFSAETRIDVWKDFLNRYATLANHPTSAQARQQLVTLDRAVETQRQLASEEKARRDERARQEWRARKDNLASCKKQCEAPVDMQTFAAIFSFGMTTIVDTIRVDNCLEVCKTKYGE